jgi:hypothetical protein
MSVVELIDSAAEWLAATPLAESIAGSGYAFPILESVHVIGVALVIGTISIVDLRLLGYAWKGRAVRDVANHMLPIAWAGFCVALISGALMFISNATQYVHNLFFQLKFLLLFIAGINMAAFHSFTWRSVAGWDAAASPPAAVKLAGAVSLSCWVAVVFLGRWVGFV